MINSIPYQMLHRRMGVDGHSYERDAILLAASCAFREVAGVVRQITGQSRSLLQTFHRELVLETEPDREDVRQRFCKHAARMIFDIPTNYMRSVIGGFLHDITLDSEQRVTEHPDDDWERWCALLTTILNESDVLGRDFRFNVFDPLNAERANKNVRQTIMAVTQASEYLAIKSEQLVSMAVELEQMAFMLSRKVDRDT